MLKLKPQREGLHIQYVRRVVAHLLPVHRALFFAAGLRDVDLKVLDLVEVYDIRAEVDHVVKRADLALISEEPARCVRERDELPGVLVDQNDPEFAEDLAVIVHFRDIHVVMTDLDLVLKLRLIRVLPVVKPHGKLFRAVLAHLAVHAFLIEQSCLSAANTAVFLFEKSHDGNHLLYCFDNIISR